MLISQLLCTLLLIKNVEILGETEVKTFYLFKKSKRSLS